MLDGSSKLITLEKWPNENLKSMFNLLADIIWNEEEKLKDIKKTVKSRTMNTLQNQTTRDNKTENNAVDKIMTQNPDKANKGIEILAL